MYSIKYTSSFKKDFKRISRRNYNLDLLKNTIDILSKQGKLPPKYKPHKLSGYFSNFWECHIQADWLLLWSVDIENHTLYLYRTGTHSDLF